MLQTFGELLPYAVPVALGPIPIIVILMLLLSPAGNRGGLCFLAGRIAAVFGLTLGVSLLVILLDRETGSGQSRAWLRLCLGLLLYYFAARKVQKALKNQDTEVPGWIRAVESATPARALKLGIILTVVNVKEVAFAAGAGIILGASALPFGQSLILAVIYSLLAALGVIVPLVWAMSVDPSSKARLIPARDWLVRNQAIVVAGVVAIIGTMLVGKALAELGAGV